MGYAKDTDMLAALAQSPADCFLIWIAVPTAEVQQDTLLEKIQSLSPAIAVIACVPGVDTASITQTARCVTVPVALDNAVLCKAVTMAIRSAC